MKKALWGFIVSLLIFSSAGVCYLYLTANERAVRKLTEDLVDFVCKEKSDLPHAGVLKYARVDELFCQQIVIRCETPDIDRKMSDEELKILVMSAMRNVEYLDVHSEDVEVELSDDHAVFSFDAQVDGAMKGGKGGFRSSVVAVSGSCEKNNGQWKISSLLVEDIVK